MQKTIIATFAGVAIFFDLGLTVIFDTEPADHSEGLSLLAVIAFTPFI